MQVPIVSPVMNAPQALAALSRGIDRLASLLALTLGPTQGVIVNAQSGRSAPELLTESGVIARRVVELPNRAEDTGAQILRAMVQEVHEQYGDGAATAAVLASAMVRSSLKQIAAGANPMRLRAGIERGAAAASRALAACARPVNGVDELSALAVSVTSDEALGTVLGEMIDVLGRNAALVVDEYYSPYLEREYIDGGRWTGRPAARDLLPAGNPEINLQNPLVLVTDQELTRVDDMVPAFEIALRVSPKRPLLIAARDVKDQALTTLLANVNRGVLQAMAVIPTGASISKSDELDDLALLTGAQLFSDMQGQTTRQATLPDLGACRQALVRRETFTIVGGGGDAGMRQKRIADLRARAVKAGRSSKEWQKLRLRAARLAGGVGILKIGARYEKERDLRKELALHAARLLDLALDEGVLPGGGVAYLNIRGQVLAERNACADDDEAAGLVIVAEALSAPFMQIVKNGGEIHPPLALATAVQMGPGYGLNVLTNQYVDMNGSSILDCAAVLRGAIEAAASAAAMAITTDTIIFQKG